MAGNVRTNHRSNNRCRFGNSIATTYGATIGIGYNYRISATAQTVDVFGSSVVVPCKAVWEHTTLYCNIHRAVRSACATNICSCGVQGQTGRLSNGISNSGSTVVAVGYNYGVAARAYVG